MATFTRQIVFSGFQFDPARELTEYGIREELRTEVPELVVYDVYLTDASNRNDPFLDREALLQVVQHRVENGERHNVVHELRAGDWLIEDVFAEEGWSVVSNSDLTDILS